MNDLSGAPEPTEQTPSLIVEFDSAGGNLRWRFVGSPPVAQVINALELIKAAVLGDQLRAMQAAALQRVTPVKAGLLLPH